MDIYNDWIQNLPAVERSRLVEQIWDGLSLETSPIPLPESAVFEAKRRRDEPIAEPQLGNSHDDVWKRINKNAMHEFVRYHPDFDVDVLI